jgi:hypothetical protein
MQAVRKVSRPSGRSAGSRKVSEKEIHHCPVMQELCKLQSEEFLLRPALFFQQHTILAMQCVKAIYTMG